MLFANKNIIVRDPIYSSGLVVHTPLPDDPILIIGLFIIFLINYNNNNNLKHKVCNYKTTAIDYHSRISFLICSAGPWLINQGNDREWNHQCYNTSRSRDLTSKLRVLRVKFAAIWNREEENCVRNTNHEAYHFHTRKKQRKLKLFLACFEKYYIKSFGKKQNGR